jgi:hypothetical protein
VLTSVVLSAAKENLLALKCRQRLKLRTLYGVDSVMCGGEAVDADIDGDEVHQSLPIVL